ncbi:MAG: dihydrolipoamide acetyltransferase family protein [Actinomycetota bacterium]
MAEIIRMPEVLAGAEEGTIYAWSVSEGDSVAAGQTIAEIETEKATVELDAEGAGTIGRLLAPAGTNVAVGEPIFVLLANGEGTHDVDRALSAAGLGANARPETDEPIREDTPGAAPADTARELGASDVTGSRALPETTGRERNSRLFMSPLVRRLVAQHGLDPQDISGTGPGGRIVRRDLERHLEVGKGTPTPAKEEPAEEFSESSSNGASFEDIPLTRMRKAIARRLTESKSSVPHFYLVADCHVDALLALRQEINATASRKISVNDLVLKAVAGALVDVPEANAIWNGESIRRFHAVDISLAVATEGGLFTPVLRDVANKSLSAVSAEAAELIEKSREGKLRQQDLEGGAFSVSNLGMFGTSEFSAILNPPQSGILAVGAALKKPTVGDDGEIAVATVMTVTLSADHRVLDGAVAAQWLAAFQRRVEQPMSILI